MKLLDGKVALVTGAGTGIGREAAILLASDGARVILTGRRLQPLQEVAALIESEGGSAVARFLDIESRDDILETIAWVRNAVGPVDILVNNAGSASKVLKNGEVHSPKGKAVLETGDRLQVETPGGGGWGKAHERSVDLIEQDLVDGLITPEAAKKHYGYTGPASMAAE